MKIIKSLLTIFPLVILFSCTTNISTIPIKDSLIRVNHNSNEVPADLGLSPGEVYYVYFQVQHQKTLEWIKNANWNDIQLTSKDHSLFISSDKITVPDFNFNLINKPWYSFEIRVKYNSYPKQTRKYPVNWTSQNQFRFKGTDGDESYQNKGGHGKQGPFVEVEAAYYDVTGTTIEGQGPFILVHAPQLKKIMLFKVGTGIIPIESSGGKGGNGANGQNRHISSNEQEVFGGKGYDGGDGGDGGTIRFKYPIGADLMPTNFTFQVEGGQRGKGGLGGSGEKREKDSGVIGFLEATLGVNPGPYGEEGRDGRRGSFETINTKLEALFLNCNYPGFERSRLRSTP